MAARAEGAPLRVKDYFIFGWFCFVVFVYCSPFLNVNAIIRIWKQSGVFLWLCEDPNALDCAKQHTTAKLALLLYQSSYAFSAMLSGHLVDLFTPAMGMISSHMLYGFGAYFLRSNTTQAILLACVFHGFAGEMLVNSILPVCSMFGNRQNAMLAALSLFSDLGVLLSPLLLYLGPAPNVDITVHEKFYLGIWDSYLYFTIASSFIGVYIFPYDDPAVAAPQPGVFDEFKMPAPVAPQGKLANASVTVAVAAVGGGGGGGGGERAPLVKNEVPVGAVSNRSAEGGLATEEEEEVPVLWQGKLKKKIRSRYFAMVVIFHSVSVLRNSFFLNNNQQIFESMGDDRALTTGFMWMMGLGAIYGPICWVVNDTLGIVPLMCLYNILATAVNVLLAVGYLPIQWLTLILFPFCRTTLAPSTFTYIAALFGYEELMQLGSVVGFFGASFNLLNVVLDQYVEGHMQGDYETANLWMIGLGGLLFMLTLFYAMVPPAKVRVVGPTELPARLLTPAAPPFALPQKFAQLNEETEARERSEALAAVYSAGGDSSSQLPPSSSNENEDGDWEDVQDLSRRHLEKNSRSRQQARV